MRNIAIKLFTENESFQSFITRIAGEYQLLHNDNIKYDKFYNKLEADIDTYEALCSLDEEKYYENLIKFYKTNATDSRLKEDYDVYVNKLKENKTSKKEYLQDQLNCLSKRLEALKQADIGYEEIIDKAIKVVEQAILEIKDEIAELDSSTESPVDFKSYRQYMIDFNTEKLNKCKQKNKQNAETALNVKKEIENFYAATNKKLW